MSEQDLELERLRHAFASRGAASSSGAACPPVERLWSAVHNELTPEEVRPLVAHLVDCGACAEAWRLARETDARGTEEAAVSSAAPPPQAWGRWAALAAGIAAVGLGSILLRRAPAPVPGFREGPSAQIRSLAPEASPLPRSRCLLRWSPGPENASYSVQVATERLEPIAVARGLTATEYVVPPDRLASVPSGTKLLWRVEALTADGARVSSATFVSRLE